MTIEGTTPQLFVGPPVGNLSTTASVFSTAQLKQSGFLPSLVKTINLCYADSHALKPEMGMTTAARLASVESLLDSISDDPELFILIIHHAASSSVIATATCRRYLGPSEDTQNPWLRRIPVHPGCEEWELKLMATHPSVQKQGLASFMLGLAEHEVVRRHEVKYQRLCQGLDLGDIRPERNTVRMVLCTARELYGDFYLKKGYKKDHEVYRGGSENFHVIFMSKTLLTGRDMAPPS